MSRIHHLAGMVAVGAGMLLSLAPSAAQAAQPVWTCRASAVAVTGLTPNPIEPIVANNTPTGGCADSDATQNVGQSGLAASGGFARTQIDPDNVPAPVQTLESSAGVDSATIDNGSGFALTVGHVESTVTAQCNGTTPAFDSSGQLGTVTINGQAVSTDSTLTQVGDGLNGSPIGGLIQVHFNEVTSTSTGLMRRGVHVQILDATGATVYDAVVGEAKVASQGLTCSPGIPEGGCPAGSVELNGVCIIEVPVGGDNGPNSGGNSVSVTILGANPGGGFITSPSLLPTALKRGPCSKKSLKIATVIIGTKHADHITGTNRNDRIMSLAGRDRLSGGRGNDCVEAGSGNDQIDGSNDNDREYGQAGKDIISGAGGKDRLYGGAGNDKLSGGSGNDYLSGGAARDKLSGDLGADNLVGGAGNDYINTDNGKDRVAAGAGNDAVNASTAGRPARVNCGPGRDTVRMNHNEMKRTKGCERRLVTHRV
jgi:Ca2+-binding RTX toxin-like protein